MHILITGGAGYIGSVTAALVSEAGHRVTVLDSLVHGNRDAVHERARFIEDDIGNLVQLVGKADSVDAVIHLASFIAAGESMVKPELYWQANTVASLRLLDAIRLIGIKKLVFASTAAVYGNTSQALISEDAPTLPASTYGMTKLATDMAITSEARAHGLAAVSLRFFNVAGAYKDYGERHPQETHIIPLMLRAAAEDKPFTIFGTDYDTPDGTCIRDYVHVADLARAMLLALNTMTPGRHDIYNLGNGVGFSNREVIRATEVVTGKKVTVLEGPRREGDPARLVASSDKAKRELGWKPRHTKLEDIVRDAWKAYQRPVSK